MSQVNDTGNDEATESVDFGVSGVTAKYNTLNCCEDKIELKKPEICQSFENNSSETPLNTFNAEDELVQLILKFYNNFGRITIPHVKQIILKCSDNNRETVISDNSCSKFISRYPELNIVDHHSADSNSPDQNEIDKFICDYRLETKKQDSEKQRKPEHDLSTTINFQKESVSVNCKISNQSKKNDEKETNKLDQDSDSDLINLHIPEKEFHDASSVLVDVTDNLSNQKTECLLSIQENTTNNSITNINVSDNQADNCGKEHIDSTEEPKLSEKEVISENRSVESEKNSEISELHNAIEESIGSSSRDKLENNNKILTSVEKQSDILQETEMSAVNSVEKGSEILQRDPEFKSNKDHSEPHQNNEITRTSNFNNDESNKNKELRLQPSTKASSENDQNSDNNLMLADSLIFSGSDKLHGSNPQLSVSKKKKNRLENKNLSSGKKRKSNKNKIEKPKKRKYLYKLKSLSGSVIYFTSPISINFIKPVIKLTRLNENDYPHLNDSMQENINNSDLTIHECSENDLNSSRMQTRRKQLKFLPDGTLISPRQTFETEILSSSSPKRRKKPIKTEPQKIIPESCKSEAKESFIEIKKTNGQNKKPQKIFDYDSYYREQMVPNKRLSESDKKQTISVSRMKSITQSANIGQLKVNPAQTISVSRMKSITQSANIGQLKVNPAQLLSCLLGMPVSDDQIRTVRFKPPMRVQKLDNQVISPSELSSNNDEIKPIIKQQIQLLQNTSFVSQAAHKETKTLEKSDSVVNGTTESKLR